MPATSFANLLGVAVIAFAAPFLLGLAGAALRLIDQDQLATHPNFPLKLEAIGYGFLIPVFFVSSGLQFDLRALFASLLSLLRLPIFLLAPSPCAGCRRSSTGASSGCAAPPRRACSRRPRSPLSSPRPPSGLRWG